MVPEQNVCKVGTVTLLLEAEPPEQIVVTYNQSNGVGGEGLARVCCDLRTFITSAHK